MSINIRIIGRIAVKRPLGLGDQPHVSFFVGAGDQGIGHFGGLVPGDLQLGLLAQQKWEQGQREAQAKTAPAGA